MEQVFFNVPLAKLKPIFKEWVKEAQAEALLLQKEEPQSEPDNPLSIKDVAKLTGYTVPTLYGYCQRNEIPFSKKSHRLFFFKSEIIDWIKTGKQKTLKELQADADAYLSNNKKGLQL